MFNLNDYEDVDTRIHKFYETFPDGSIHTELIQNDDEKGIVIFKATAFRTYADSVASAIGYARGARKDRGVDRDFWFENCETSAIGRCLANLGLSARGKRASSLEMAKVADAQADGKQPVRVRTKEHKEFIEQRNPEAEIVWDTTLEPPADEPAFSRADDLENLLGDVLGAQPIPTCKHGARILREGTGKKGAYRGWSCPLPYRQKAEQCKTIWMILDPSGKWSFRPEDEELVAG
jgi:hypothetical protein